MHPTAPTTAADRLRINHLELEFMSFYLKNATLLAHQWADLSPLQAVQSMAEEAEMTRSARRGSRS